MMYCSVPFLLIFFIFNVFFILVLYNLVAQMLINDIVKYSFLTIGFGPPLI